MTWLPVFTAEEGGGIATSLKVEDGQLFLKQEQDVEGILDANKALQADPSASKGKHWHRVASVPFIVLQMWAREAGVKVDDPAFSDVVKRRLNDPDFRHVRTLEGKV